MNKIQFLNTTYLPTFFNEQTIYFCNSNLQDQNVEKQCSNQDNIVAKQNANEIEISCKQFSTNFEIEIENNIFLSQSSDEDKDQTLDQCLRQFYEQLQMKQNLKEETKHYQSKKMEQQGLIQCANQQQQQEFQPLPPVQQRLISFGLRTIEEQEEIEDDYWQEDYKDDEKEEDVESEDTEEIE